LRAGRSEGGPAWCDAQSDVICEHLWLARAIAHRYSHRGVDDEDLVQVACLGLVEAVQRFDPEQGDFLAFALPTISGVVKRYFRDHGWLVRPPRHTQELVAGVRREWPRLTQELGQLPSDGQVATRLGESVADVAEARRASQGYSPMSVDMMTDGHACLGTADGEGFERAEARLIIQRALAQLDEEDRRLIWMRFYQGRSQSDIAAEIGTSQMQVSRRLARLLARLRSIVGAQDRSLLAS
jgi:RNA polymerase sigma-B factor